MNSSAAAFPSGPEAGDALNAFISYSHADRRAAAFIQTYIERYPLPGGAKRLRVFLDETDIRSGELSAELGQALEEAGSLIVCCSPSSTESKWVEKEVAAFLRHDERVVVPIVLRGSPEAVIPAALRAREYRYLDLRGRWLFGLLDAKGRIEMARGIARVVGLPLRDLVDWERRRQRRFVAIAGVATLSALVVAAFFPLDYQHDLQVSELVEPLRSMEFAEVRDDALLIAAREKMVGPQGMRDYVAYYPDVLKSPEWKWLGFDCVEFRTRLTSLPGARPCWDPGGLPAVKAALDAASDLAKQRARENEAVGPGLVANFGPGRPWIGKPLPGLAMAIDVVAPIPVERADLEEGLVTPPAGDGIVAVGWPDGEVRVAGLVGFDPDRPVAWDPRSVDVLRMVPVAASKHRLWVGMRAREDGRMGGLWHSADGGRSWSRVPGFSSVGSIVVDPRQPDRVIVATAPGRWKSGVREGVLATEIFVQEEPGGRWSPLDPAPPYGTASQIQLAGFFSDGALAVQVDGNVFELGRDHWARRVFGNYRHAVEKR